VQQTATRDRRRLALRLGAALVALGLLLAAGWTRGALGAVDAVEAERDNWQRPGDVLQALELADGSAAADLGSGVGYFALKLSDVVGARGRVLAVDVRRFPLLFLRVRALVRGRRNLELVRAEPDDPRLPAGALDAVLVANTFHELAQPERVLARARAALRPGGRLVVVDPAPAEPAQASGLEPHRHASAAAAEACLRRSGFEIRRSDDSFIDAPGRGRWWLIVARKPPLAFAGG
jgi:SAM-dependent methyltransferase